MCTVPQHTGIDRDHETNALERQQRSMRRLVKAVQELSLARDMQAIAAVVRQAARDLTGADGATFVLRDGDRCHYADEDAIAPLWKGLRFPMNVCISGWVMNHRCPVVVEDIYKDPRIPVAAYEPTFVKSLAMVPIRTENPIGAIGNYWARHRQTTSFELEVLQALANTTAVAIENVQLYENLEQRVRERTLQIEDTNRELEAYTSSVSHDLRGPLHAIDGYANLLEYKLKPLNDSEANDHLTQIRVSARRMTEVTSDLLRLARIASEGLAAETVDLTRMAEELLASLRMESPGRAVVISIQSGLTAVGDPGLLHIALDNLLSNAWKYTSKRARTVIDIAGGPIPGGWMEFRIRDNGAGFDAANANHLFVPFQRLHRDDEFTGTGVGLATVQRIIHRHGGRLWAEGQMDRGASFYFTLPGPNATPALAG
jgi:signal transduction histidine kinase